MGTAALAALTPEQRAENLAKAQAARAAKAATRRASALRSDFLDMHTWEDLASARGVRLPPPGEGCTAGVMRRFLGRAQRSVTWYYATSGEKTLHDFARRNPQWPARAWAGLVLEAVVREEHSGDRHDMRPVRRPRSPPRPIGAHGPRPGGDVAAPDGWLAGGVARLRGHVRMRGVYSAPDEPARCVDAA